MNVGDLIDEDTTPTPLLGEFLAGDLVIMPSYHGEHKFLVLGGQVLEYLKKPLGGFIQSNDVVVTGIEPGYETFMKIHSIESHKIKKVGVIQT